MKASDLYAHVTNTIVAELEQGTAPWVKPWSRGKTTGIMPANAATGRPYSGINIPILWHAAGVRGFPSHRWMTFHQAREKDATVRKGERGTTVVFTKRITVEEDDSERHVSMLRSFTVFNVAQIDGIAILEEAAEPVEIRIETADRFIMATGADIRVGGDQAFYAPVPDLVALPPLASFARSESYYATALHELGHWTGHNSRLDRTLGKRFGSRAYAAEELIAELSAAFLCAHLGITGELRHSGYIQNWIGLLREDSRAIFTAASKASQAADYLRAFSPPAQEEHDVEPA